MHGTSYNASDMWVTRGARRRVQRLHARHPRQLLRLRLSRLRQQRRHADRGGHVHRRRGGARLAVRARDIDPAQIFFYGFSLGTGIATELAMREPSRGADPARAVHVGARPGGRPVSEPHPRALLLAPWLPLTSYDTLCEDPALTGPLLVMHGDSDRPCPSTWASGCSKRRPSRSATSRSPAAGHSDVSADLVVPHITQFIDDVLAGTLQPGATTRGRRCVVAAYGRVPGCGPCPKLRSCP